MENELINESTHLARLLNSQNQCEQLLKKSCELISKLSNVTLTAQDRAFRQELLVSLVQVRQAKLILWHRREQLYKEFKTIAESATK